MAVPFRRETRATSETTRPTHPTRPWTSTLLDGASDPSFPDSIFSPGSGRRWLCREQGPGPTSSGKTFDRGSTRRRHHRPSTPGHDLRGRPYGVSDLGSQDEGPDIGLGPDLRKGPGPDPRRGGTRAEGSGRSGPQVTVRGPGDGPGGPGRRRRQGSVRPRTDRPGTGTIDGPSRDDRDVWGPHTGEQDLRTRGDPRRREW